MSSLRHFAKWVLPGILILPSSCNQQAKEDKLPVKPNIIFIIADDMNWDDCGAYGHPLIRNFFPDLPNTPPADALKSMTFQSMLELKEEGELTGDQMNVFISPTPEEELYDLDNDPFELNNLAENMQYTGILKKMQKVLNEFMDSTNDRIPETLTPDEFDRRTGDTLPNRQWPRPGKFEQEGTNSVEKDPI